MPRFLIVEKKNHNAVHVMSHSKKNAERILEEDIPRYVKKGFYMDKTLTKDCFEVIEAK